MSFQCLTVFFKTPSKLDKRVSRGPATLYSRQTSIASEGPRDPREKNPDPNIQQAIDAIQSFGTSRTKLKNIPRSTLLSACSSFQIGAGDETFSSLKKPEILSKVHDWVCGPHHPTLLFLNQ